MHIRYCFFSFLLINYSPLLIKRHRQRVSKSFTCHNAYLFHTICLTPRFIAINYVHLYIPMRAFILNFIIGRSLSRHFCQENVDPKTMQYQESKKKISYFQPNRKKIWVWNSLKYVRKCLYADIRFFDPWCHCKYVFWV